MGAINKILGTVGGVLGLAVLAGGVAMAVPESRNWILDEVAKSSNAYKTQVKENDELRLEISELKTDIANKQSEVTTLTEQKVVLLNAVTKIDNEINTTTDKTTLDNLQEKKTAILNQVDDLNGQIADKQAEIERLQARVDELENSVQLNVTNVGETNSWAGLITDEFASLLENATDDELNQIQSGNGIQSNSIFLNVGNSDNLDQNSNVPFSVLKNLNGFAFYQSSGRTVDFDCDYGQFNGFERLCSYSAFELEEHDVYKRGITHIDLNLTYKLENGTVIDINSYDDKTTLKSYRCENVNVNYDENYKITAFTGDIVILSMEEVTPEVVEEQTATLISGSSLNSAIGTEVTAVTFDRYTDSEQQTYVVDGVNVIDGISPVSVSTSDSVGSANLYMVDNKAYILSKDKIVANSDMSNAFRGLSSLIDLNLTNLDTSNVTNMSNMFAFCSSLNSLDVSNFDTSNVTDMNGMFGDCSELTNLDLSNFDTNNVTSMAGMFVNCILLTTIYVGDGWNVDNVTSSSDMFYHCSNLPNFDENVFDKTNAYVGGYLTSITQSAEI